jgi:hypothetical protein
VFGIFKPKSIGIPDALKLLFDDFAEQWSRSVIRFQHATHVDVHIVLRNIIIIIIMYVKPNMTNDITEILSTCNSKTTTQRLKDLSAAHFLIVPVKRTTADES